MLSDLIKPENILMDLESSEKDVLFAEMLEVLISARPEINRDEAMEALLKREEKMSTCVMKGVAVPHANCSSVTKTVAALGISYSGIDYGAIESSYGRPFEESLVHIVIMILFEPGNSENHLHVLTDCASVLQVPGFYKAVMAAKTVQEVYSVIREYELGY